jgi:hypothetical protein
MKVLIACEFSGVVREAFHRRGHDAWSCDLAPAADNSAFHIQGDARRACCSNWDLIIAHPPCTFLAVSGARWWKDRIIEQEEAAAFFMFFTHLCCRYAIENPIGAMSRLWRKPDQIIQPWQFGHGETKATCLWLKGLSPLKPTNIVAGRVPRVHFESPGIVNGLTRQQRRSITLQGIADAMAEQWGVQS